MQTPCTCIGTEDIIILYLPVLVLRALLFLVPTCVGLEGIIISCTYLCWSWGHYYILYLHVLVLRALLYLVPTYLCWSWLTQKWFTVSWCPVCALVVLCDLLPPPALSATSVGLHVAILMWIPPDTKLPWPPPCCLLLHLLLQLKEHFRPFKQSPLFLRYQNQLLHTISEGDDCSEDPSSELGTASEQVVDLDDPEELWCRAHLPWDRQLAHFSLKCIQLAWMLWYAVDLTLFIC